jgi:hypothetical protein
MNSATNYSYVLRADVFNHVRLNQTRSAPCISDAHSEYAMPDIDQVTDDHFHVSESNS